MAKQSTFRTLEGVDLDTIGYRDAWELQKARAELRKAGAVEDRLYLLEHPHTYTLGKTADKKNLVGNQEWLDSRGVEVFEIDRGGDITYHGPGQIVGYPIIHLSAWKEDAHEYLRALEETLIRTLADYEITAGRSDGFTGVWVEGRKIAAIGVKISRWVTMHGFALNVNTDLELFRGIVPCGLVGKPVTSMQAELGREIPLGDVKARLFDKFVETFGYDEFARREEDLDATRKGAI
jgi:lipoate-protein ligase B